jgi:plasmid stabilization system protein ParE
LHDELVAVTARWTDPTTRKEPLKPYAEDSEEKTLILLEESLVDPRLHDVQDQVKHNLANSAERDVKELLGFLERRSEDLAARAIEKLTARGEREAQDLSQIIQAQRKRISEAIKKYETDTQLVLSFKEPMEVSQLEADHRHWEKRLRASEEELRREPARIRESYVVKARRIEPVGLVYLWPISG